MPAAPAHFHVGHQQSQLNRNDGYKHEDWPVPVSRFKSDGDPNTLELVFLEKSDPGANTVSDDGEVIFLFEASDKVQSKLIGQAFEIRAKRRLGAVQPGAVADGSAAR